jgi:hypothetical protein
VLIMLLAARGPRLRSLASMRLGVNVLREEEGWRIDFGESDMKTARALSYSLPSALEKALDRYVEVERAELLAGQVEDALWVNWDGKPLGKDAIAQRIRWRSEKKFGKAGTFGPHRFRYGIATLGPMADPEAPTIGASVLGITPHTANAAYDRGGRASAAKRYHGVLAEERAQTATLARNIFARRARGFRDDDDGPTDGV